MLKADVCRDVSRLVALEVAALVLVLVLALALAPVSFSPSCARNPPATEDTDGVDGAVGWTEFADVGVVVVVVVVVEAADKMAAALVGAVAYVDSAGRGPKTSPDSPEA